MWPSPQKKCLCHLFFSLIVLVGVLGFWGGAPWFLPPELLDVRWYGFDTTSYSTRYPIRVKALEYGALRELSSHHGTVIVNQNRVPDLQSKSQDPPLLSVD
eukprot:4597995-Amphidinium_carterae.1